MVVSSSNNGGHSSNSFNVDSGLQIFGKDNISHAIFIVIQPYIRRISCAISALFSRRAYNVYRREGEES